MFRPLNIMPTSLQLNSFGKQTTYPPNDRPCLVTNLRSDRNFWVRQSTRKISVFFVLWIVFSCGRTSTFFLEGFGAVNMHIFPDHGSQIWWSLD